MKLQEKLNAAAIFASVIPEVILRSDKTYNYLEVSMENEDTHFPSPKVWIHNNLNEVIGSFWLYDFAVDTIAEACEKAEIDLNSEDWYFPIRTLEKVENKIDTVQSVLERIQEANYV